MFTKLKKEELVSLGMRHRAGYLLEQYGYTMGLARLDEDGIAGLLPRGFLEDLAACAEGVRGAMQDKTLKAAESKGATRDVSEVMRLAKEWRRKANYRALCGKRIGNNIPAGLIKADVLSSVPAVAGRLSEMVKLLESARDEIPGGGVDKLIDEGIALAASVHSIDADQEIKRGATAPAAVAVFNEEKGRLYSGIKAVNDAGRALHAGDSLAAARYNLSILHRHAGKRKENPAADAGK